MTNLTANNPEKNLFISSAVSLNGVLKVQGFGDDYEYLKDQYLDHLGTFKNWSKVIDFASNLDEMGMSTYFDVPGNISYHSLKRFASSDFSCHAKFLEKNNLYRFQHTGMNYIYNILCSDPNPRALVQWSPGAGKTPCANLIAQKLFDEGRIDLVLCFCKKIKQLDWVESFKNNTYLDAIQIDGPRASRHATIASTMAQVIVMNYEKARFPSRIGRAKKEYDWSKTDLQQLIDLMAGKRVLIICDEAQKINHSSSQLSQGFNILFNNKITSNRPLWVGGLALTATPYTISPINIRDLYSILVPELPEVSIPKYQFEQMYMDHRWGRDNFGEVRKWDPEQLYLLGKKYEKYSHTVSKNDPDIAAQFPSQIEKTIQLELSDVDKKLYRSLEREIYKIKDWNYIDLRATVSLLRSVCNTSEAILHSQSKFGSLFKELVTTTNNNNKFQYIVDLIKDILSNNEKIVLFTFWTHNTLFPYKEALRKAVGSNTPLFSIWGEGMNPITMKENIDNFNNTKGGAILLSSDVGQDGINLYAENVVHIETPSVYSSYRQRSDRINRTDSIDKGISHNIIYRFITENTIEVPIEKKMLNRKFDSGIIQSEEESFQTLTNLLYNK